MPTPLDRASENVAVLLANCRQIIAAVTAGRIGLSANEAARYETFSKEHEVLLKMYAENY